MSATQQGAIERVGQGLKTKPSVALRPILAPPAHAPESSQTRHLQKLMHTTARRHAFLAASASGTLQKTYAVLSRYVVTECTR
jgi:hypothetical protein